MIKIVFKISLILVFIFALGANPGVARLQYVEVQAEGSGENLKVAIYEALQMAISQVNGTAMSFKEASSLKSTTESTDDASKFKATEKFQQDVSAATKGVVKNFSIVRSAKTDDGDFEVLLTATIAKLQTSKQTNRLRIAVVPLQANKGKVASSAANSLTQALVTHLTQTRKFAIIDREFMEAQQVELDHIRSGDTPVEELAKLGNRLSTDYILVGKIGRISFQPRTVKMRTTNIEFKKTDVKFELTYRIIDVSTGQVKFSDEYSYSETMDGHGVGVSNISENASRSIVQTILNAIFPLRIETVRGRNVYIGQGGKGIRVGQEYKLVQLGREITDTYTDENIGREEIVVGRVKIISVQSKQSVARILKSTIDVVAATAQRALILRPIHNSSSAGSKKKSSRAFKEAEKEAEDEFEKMESKNDKDW